MARLVGWCTLGLVAGCNQILGIERLTPDAAVEDAGGTTISAVATGATGATGATPPPAAGAAADSGAGAPATSAAGSGGEPAPAAVAPQPPESPEPAPTTDDAGPVQGHVVDFLRHDLANVTVRIGTSTTQTDAEGRFTIAAVSAEYDLTVMLTYPADDHDTQVTWQWLGLTRRDPTLQVLKGAQPRLATTILYLDQIDFPLAPSQRTITVWTSPDCATSWDASAAAEGPIDLVFSGPSRTSGQARTLLYEVTGTPELPSAYSAYHEQPFTLTDGARELPFHADLSADMIATKTLSGVITGSSWNRKLSVYLRFPDDSAIRLLSDYRVSDSFSYLVPDLPSATFTVVVDDHQDDQNQGLVEAHAAGLAAGASNITLTLPERPTLDAPSPDESAVDGQTLFEWHGDARVYLLCAETDATHERVCVTTAKQRAKLPFGSPVTRAQYVWNVAQHDHYRSVDEAAGADGQLSAYVPGNGAVVGPKRGDGLLAISASRAFTTKP